MNYSCFFGSIALNRPDYRIVMILLYVITGIPAIILNSLVLYSIWKTPLLHKPSYILLASLALSDLLNGSFGQYLMVLTNIAALKHWNSALFCYSWVGGRVMSYWLTSVSLYTLAIISIDRLLAIKKKTRYRSIVTMKRIIIIVVEFWIKSIVVVLIFLFKLEIDKNLFAYLSFIGTAVFLMLSTITICYSLAYYYLKKATHTVSPSNENKLATNIDINVAKYRKSLNTMLLIFVVLILFYFPYVTSAIGSAVVLAANKASPSKGIKTTIYQFITSCELLAFVNSTVNPLMYLCRMRDIRKAVVAVVKGIFPRKRLTKENTVSIQDE